MADDGFVRDRSPPVYGTGPVMREEDFMEPPKYGRLDDIRPGGAKGRDLRLNPGDATPLPRNPVRRTKKGGLIKSKASSRADGCAIKGKTKGRYL